MNMRPAVPKIEVDSTHKLRTDVRFGAQSTSILGIYTSQFDRRTQNQQPWFVVFRYVKKAMIRLLQAGNSSEDGFVDGEWDEGQFSRVSQ